MHLVGPKEFRGVVLCHKRGVERPQKIPWVLKNTFYCRS